MIEVAHDHHETFAFLSKQILRWHLHILEKRKVYVSLCLRAVLCPGLCTLNSIKVVAAAAEYDVLMGLKVMPSCFSTNSTEMPFFVLQPTTK